jgi:Uncharacterized protein conserved in bacteria (DUF2336).
VARGDQEVVNSVASNAGARFSDFGFLHMVKRAEGDSILAEQLGLRRDIPRRIFQQFDRQGFGGREKSGWSASGPGSSTKFRPRWPMSRARCSPSSVRYREATLSQSGW